MIHPPEIPTFPGDCDGIEASARKLLQSGTGITVRATAIHSTVQDLATSYRAPEGGHLFAATLPVRQQGLELGEHVRVVGTILNAFATEMRPVAKDLKDLKADAQDFVDENGCDPDQAWLEDEAKVEKNNQMIDDVSAKVERMWEIERTYANAIEALFGGKQWVAGVITEDGEIGSKKMGSQRRKSADTEIYGLAEIPDGAEVPWGTPAEYDAPWYEDAWNMQLSYMKGFWVDGVGGMLDGLTTLIPLQPIAGSLGVPYMNDWGDSGDAWANLLPTAAIWGSGVGILGVVADQFGLLPDQASDLVGVANENALGMLKGVVAWDTWGEDPARAAGASVFNIGSMFIPGPKGLGGAKAGGLVDDAARFADDAAKVDDFVPKVTTVVDDVAKNIDGLAGYGKSARELSTYGKGLEDLASYGKNARELSTYGKNADDLAKYGKNADDLADYGKNADDLADYGKGDDAAPPGAGDDAAKSGDDATKPGDEPVTPEEAARRHDLGWDPAVKKFRANEAETALRIEDATGEMLHRSPHRKGPDWFDDAGKTYDAVGNFPGKYFDKQWPNLQKQIVGHLDKADFVPIDVAKLSPEQVSKIKAFIETENLGPRVFIVGE